MAHPADHSLHDTGGGDGTLRLALVLVNVVLLSATLLLCCSFWRRKKADLTKTEIKRERPKSELKKVVTIPENNGTNHGVISSGSTKITNSQKHKSKIKEPEKNGDVVKDGDQASLKRRNLPLPPVNATPPEFEDPLYDCVKDEQNPLKRQSTVEQTSPGPNEKHLASTAGSNLTTAVNGGDIQNPDLLENINPLYTSVEDARMENLKNQKFLLDLPAPGPNQKDEMTKEPTSSSLPSEPIYAVVCKNKLSIIKPLVIQQETVSEDSRVELADLHGGNNWGNVESPAANLTNSIRLSEMIKRSKSKHIKIYEPKPDVAINIDLKEPPPVPDKLFDIDKEVGYEEQHPNEDKMGAEIELED